MNSHCCARERVASFSQGETVRIKADRIDSWTTSTTKLTSDELLLAAVLKCALQPSHFVSRRTDSISTSIITMTRCREKGDKPTTITRAIKRDRRRARTEPT